MKEYFMDDPDLIYQKIGRIEVIKRQVAMSEQELYDFEMRLKRGLRSEQWVSELLESTELSIEDFQNIYENLKFRRMLYKRLKKEAQKNQENTTFEGVSQNFKEEI